MFSRIREDDINEVRERTNIIDVISGYMTLKRAGRNYKGLCPFHNEKTPSFIVDTERQLWHCFGCGEGGNVYTFLMKTENLDFPETVTMLAERIGYQLQFEGNSSPSGKRGDRERFLEATKLASEYYHYILTKTGAGANALGYLRQRSISQESITEFKIGLSPARWDSLLQWMVKKGYKGEELLKAGLALRGERSQGSLYDRFRQRLMFPIRDLRGEVVGFGGRILGKGEPKYLNSPDSEIFHKSVLLYGLFEHKTDIISRSEAVVVEGYTDVILPHQFGMKTFVATLGTAFGEGHIRLLARFCRRIVLLFDGDEAGLSAAQRALDLIDRSAVEIAVAVLPDGEDPADFVIKHGVDDLSEITTGAVPVVDYCIDRIALKHDATTSAGKLKALGEIVEVLARLENALARDEYAQRVSQRFEISYEALLSEIGKKRSKQLGTALKEDKYSKQGGGAELELLKAVIQYPEQGSNFLDDLLQLTMLDAQIARMLLVITNAIKDKPGIGPAELLDCLRDAGVAPDLSGELSAPMHISEPCDYIDELLHRVRVNTIETEIRSLRRKLDSADPSSKDYDKLFSELVVLEGIKRQQMP